MKEKLPHEVFSNYLTLIVHPGPPGDRGASSLDWCVKDNLTSWGVTVLEATDVLDGGLIWGHSLFPIAKDQTKSSIYRNQVQFAAIEAITCALIRFVYFNLNNINLFFFIE